MSGTVWEPGRKMGTQEGATDAPSDLADVTHEPNQFYDPSETAADRQGGSTDSLASALAQVRQSLGEARSSTDRVIVDRLITSVEALVAVVGSTGTADQPEALAATAPPISRSRPLRHPVSAASPSALRGATFLTPCP